jgi:hypothetical protein
MGKEIKKRKLINWEKVLTALLSDASVKSAAITLILALPICVGTFFLAPAEPYSERFERDFFSDASIIYIYIYFIGLIGTVLSLTYFAIFFGLLFIESNKRSANSAAEAQRKVEAEEEDRLAKIRASMTPAEWETYKLQLENNKLLKNIQRNNNSKNTTTTIGFVE